MRKVKLPIVALLVLTLIFSNITMAFAYDSPNNVIPPTTDAIEPGDPGGGGHLCDYSSINHIVTASEAYGGNATVGLFWVGLAAMFPYALAVDIFGIFSGDLAIFTPIAGDKVISSMSASYNPSSNSYDFVNRTYTYRGAQLMNETYFTDNYSSYEDSFSLYRANCPH